MLPRPHITDQGKSINLFKGQFSPGIYFSKHYGRSSLTNSLIYRLELINNDVLSSGTPGKIVIFLQSTANSSITEGWKTVHVSEEFTDMETIEKICSLNMDIFRLKMVVSDAVVEVDLNGVNQINSYGGGHSSVQVNLPDKLLAGNETAVNWECKITYKTGDLGNQIVDKVYKFPKDSIAGEPAIIKTFTYDANENLTNIDVDENGVLV